MKSLNIFHLAAFPYYSGGIDTWLDNFLSTYDGSYQIRVYCPKPADNKPPIFDIASLKTTEIQYIGRFRSYPSMLLWSFAVFFSLFFRVDRQACTLVLSTLPTMLPVALLKIFGRLKGPVICSVRGSLAKDAIELNKGVLFRVLVRVVERGCLSFADRIVANGEDTRVYLQEFHGLASDMIPNGFRVREYSDKPAPGLMSSHSSVIGRVMMSIAVTWIGSASSVETSRWS